ncbi:MAG: serine acetyltransferase [Chitinophagales bacterium]|nr:serine acetyltransferase [Chitinophagales bacterium]
MGLARLEVQLHELLLPLQSQLLSKIDDIVQHYFATLPIIYQTLKLDAQTILQFDPAAASMQEVVSAYPGFRAIAVYRLTHQLVGMGVPTLPRLLSEYAHSQTGIDIHPGATIGSAFFIDHGTGVVIGETTHIGNNVKIYQGVTLGALNVQKDLAQTKRHPTIEDNVIIYSGSTILGGNTVIGHSSIIGGNTWITETVPPYSLVYHKAEVRIRNKQVPYTHEIDFVI